MSITFQKKKSLTIIHPIRSRRDSDTLAPHRNREHFAGQHPANRPERDTIRGREHIDEPDGCPCGDRVLGPVGTVEEDETGDAKMRKGHEDTATTEEGFAAWGWERPDVRSRGTPKKYASDAPSLSMYKIAGITAMNWTMPIPPATSSVTVSPFSPILWTRVGP